MHYTLQRVWKRVRFAVLLIICCSTASLAHAHLNWTRTNNVDADVVALYHFQDATSQVAPPAAPLTEGVGLVAVSGSPLLTVVTDTPGSIFSPNALSLPATQTLRTTDTLTELQGDLTIECWFKWNSAMTSATLELGLQSGAKILVARDTASPANDRFGVSGTHGSFAQAPGFIDWPAVGEEEASLDEWRHLALTISSAGMHYDPAAVHDVYSTGTVGRLYLNGHPVGFAPHTVDLGGLKVHDASKITAVMRGGGMMIDEFTVWRHDWSAGGTNGNPFHDGRGSLSAVSEWLDYDQ